MTRLPILAVCVALAGCGANADAVNATKIALTAAEKAAAVYVRLPLCAPKPPLAQPIRPPGGLCSDAAISVQIKAADNAAYAGVKAMSDGKISVTEAVTLVGTLTALIPAGDAP